MLLLDLDLKNDDFWKSYVEKQKLLNKDLVKEADEMFEEFTKNIGAWEPKSKIIDAGDALIISISLKNYSISEMDLKVKQEYLYLIGKKIGQKFSMRWILPPADAADVNNIVMKVLTDNVEIEIPLINGHKTISPIQYFF